MLKFHERQKMKICHGPDNSIYGQIELKHLANRKNVKVMYGKTQIIPEKFNIYGEPIFTPETTLLYSWIISNNSRMNNTTECEFDVYYAEQEFCVPRELFDTAEEIEDYLDNLRSFNNLLNYRKMFLKANKNERLNEFVIWGKFILDKFGQILTITQAMYVPSNLPEVCTLDYFTSAVYSYKVSSQSLIPAEGSYCPCCGRRFKVQSLLTDEFDLLNGKIAHKECAREYKRQQEIRLITTNMVDMVYTEKPQFEIIPFDYDENGMQISRFLFHTSDGDIIIGNSENYVSIEWQENFKPFDMAFFNDEEVTKWCGHRSILNPILKGICLPTAKRGIHADSIETGRQYLMQVKSFVNTPGFIP